MKPIVVSLLFASTLMTLAQEAPLHMVRVEKIEATIQETPALAYKGPRDKDSEARQWVEIEAELTVVTHDPTGLIPQLEAKWYAIMVDSKSGKEPKTMMLTGSSSFKDVRMETSTRDKKIHISAYIDPDTLFKLSKDKLIRPNDVLSVAVVLSGPGIANSEKYAAGLQKASTKEESLWWTKNLYPPLEGAIKAKSKTPFGLLWLDRYPAEKQDDKQAAATQP